MSSDAASDTATSTLNAEHPWPGLVAFEEWDRAFFIGRERDIETLERLVRRQLLTVLFAQSGLGKTSLLQAGLFPRLRAAEEFMPVRILLAFDSPLMAQVRMTVREAARLQQIECPIAADGEETLWETFHRRTTDFWSARNRLVTPVLVFDQFEEVFTLGRERIGRSDDLKKFLEQLSDLIEGRPPAELRKRLENDANAAAQYDFDRHRYKIVIALREDYLAHLDGLRDQVPSLARDRLRLTALTGEQALRIVTIPGKEVIDEPTAQIVVRLAAGLRRSTDESLSGAASITAAADVPVEQLHLDPAILSLLCQKLNERREQIGSALITSQLAESAGTQVIADFYEESLHDQTAATRAFIEDTLLTPSGHRDSVAYERALTALGENTIATLIQRRLLRIEARGGEWRIVLTHDVLNDAVRSSRDLRQADQERQRQADVVRSLHRRILMWGTAAVVAIAIPLAAGVYEHLLNQTKQERSRELAGRALSEMDYDPERAIALAREGMKTDTAEARSALLSAAQYVWPSAALAREDVGGELNAVAMNASGTQLAVLAGNKLISMWDVRSPKKPSQVWRQRFDDSLSIKFSPDMKLLAVGRKNSIDLLEATTGQSAAFHLPPVTAMVDRLVVFSPDNHWLATQAPGGVQLLEYEKEDASWSFVPIESLGAFAVVAGGKRIVADRDLGSGLSAGYIDQRDGKWAPPFKEFDFGLCVRPTAVSSGSRFVLVGTLTRTCTYQFPDKGESLVEIDHHGPQEPPEDMIWSTTGREYVEIRNALERHGSQDPDGDRPQDLIVGYAQPEFGPHSHLKGVHAQTSEENSRFLSVSESGTRLALIDRYAHVRVYALAHYKPFMSINKLAVATSGNWFAVITSPISDEPAKVDVIDLDRSFTSDQLLRVRKSLPSLPGVPMELHATENNLVVVLRSDEGERTIVYDGNFDRAILDVKGRAELLGAEGKLLLTVSKSGEAQRIFKTSDGSNVKAPWEDRPGGPPLQLSSPKKEALAVFRKTDGASTWNAVVYSVHGDMLVQLHQVSGLAAPVRLRLDDDGQIQSIVAPRLITVQSKSPLNRFEIRQESKGGFTVVRRTDQKKLFKSFFQSDQYQFSSDDRWLAVWNGFRMQVIDLDGAELALDMNLVDEIGETVRFVAQNKILSVSLADDSRRATSGATMLIPLDRSLIERFGKWLNPRSLTTEEQCTYLGSCMDPKSETPVRVDPK
jgi:hypothetical protein